VSGHWRGRSENGAATLQPPPWHLTFFRRQANSQAVDLVAWANNNDDDDTDGDKGKMEEKARAKAKETGVLSSQVEARRGHRLCNTATILWG